MKIIQISEKELKTKIDQGNVFVRCIPPTGMNIRNNETPIDVELRKIARIKGQPSLTKDKANTTGYPSASTSLLGMNTALFGSVGYGITKPTTVDIISVSQQNAGTGGHKKAKPQDLGVESDLAALKQFVKQGGNSFCNNEVEINIHLSSPFSFVFGPPGHEIHALYFKEKFKQFLGIDLPVFTYHQGKYPSKYQHTIESIRKGIGVTKNLDLMITLLEYYKDDSLVLRNLKTSISKHNIAGYLNGNMHVSNFIRAIALADLLEINLDSFLRESVGKLIQRLETYSSFDRQNKKYLEVLKNKTPAEATKILQLASSTLLKTSKESPLPEPLFLSPRLIQQRSNRQIQLSSSKNDLSL